MKGRRAWKKALAGVLTGALLIGTLSTVSASTVNDVDASGWWVNHSAGIELADGTVTTITFTGTTYEDYYNNWNTPIYVVYSADEAFAGGSGISETAGYAEYFVMRADVYGWEGTAGQGYGYTTVSYPDDWDTWLEDSKNGVTGTITAVHIGSILLIDYRYGDAETVAQIDVNGVENVYLSLTGECCTVTDINYEVSDEIVYDMELSLSNDSPVVNEEVTITANVTINDVPMLFFKTTDDYDMIFTADYGDISDYDEGNYQFNKNITSYETGSITVGASLTTADGGTVYATAASASYTVVAAPTAVLSNLPESFSVGDILGLNGATIEVTYADGTVETLTFSYYNAEGSKYDFEVMFFEDDYYVDMAENVGSVYAEVYMLDPTYGRYITLVATSSDIPVNARTLDSGVTVTPLTLDVEEEVSLTESVTENWFSFTPSESGYYEFVSSNNTYTTESGDTKDSYTHANLYEVDSAGNIISYIEPDSHDSIDNNFYDNYYLEAGVTYYLQAEGIVYDTVAVYSVEVTKKDITVIELLDQEYSTVAKSYKGVLFSYTPSTDGNYYVIDSFTSDSAATYTNGDASRPYYMDTDGTYSADYAYDEDDNRISTTSEDGTTYFAYALKAGVTYYIKYYYYGYAETNDETSDEYGHTYYDGTVTYVVSQIDHTHTYADKNITWTWADDLSSATAALRCDACADTVSLTATVTSTTGDSSIVYTATASYNDVEYTDTEEVPLSASTDDSETGTETASESESTDDADSEDSDSEDSDSEDTDSEDSNSEDTGSAAASSDDSGSDAATTTLAETTLTSTTAWSAITTSALTVSGDSTTTYTVTIDEAYGDDWFSVEVYDGDGNYITLNSDGTYWYYGTEGDDIVMTGSAITLEEGATYTVEIVRDGSDFTVTFYDEEGNELLSYYAANTNIDDTAATHVYAQVGSYTVSGEAIGTAASLDTTGEDSGETADDGDSNANGGSSASATNSVITTGSSTVSGSPKTGDASLLLLALMAAFGCMVTAISCKKKFLG